MRELLIKTARFFKYTALSLVFPVIYTAVSFFVSVVVGTVLVFQDMFGGLSPEALQDYDVSSLNQPEVSQRAMEMISQNSDVILIFSGVVMLLILLAVFRSRGGTLSEQIKMSPLSTGPALASVLCGVSFYFFIVTLMSVLISALPSVTEMHTEYSEISAPMFSGNMILIIIAFVIMAPLIEEILFRGLAYSSLKKGMPVWAAVVMQSAVFALVHANPFQILYVLMLAPVLALIYEWTESLYAPVLAHMSFNAVGVVMSALSEEARAHAFLGFALIPVSFITLSYFYRMNKKSGKR